MATGVYLIILLCALIYGYRREVSRGAGAPPTRQSLPCSWRLENNERQEEHNQDGLQHWRCAICGCDAHTADGRKPNRCLSA